MGDRTQRDDYRRERLSQPQNYPDMPRQPEQYASSGGQQSGWHDDDARTRWRDSGQSFRDDEDHGHYKSASYGDSASRSRRAGDNRGFLDRAGDEIASWFSNDDAERRREHDHRGHGPANYTRSDDRIREDANDRLTDDRDLDARKITVTVASGEVTLDGTVTSRTAKRRAEDCVDCIGGVKHVQNNLRVDDDANSAASSSWSGTTA